jgi:hypothetical protein
MKTNRSGGLPVPGGRHRRRLKREGRRDGRLGIPAPEAPHPPAPCQLELRNEAILGVRAIGAELFERLGPYDKAVAAAGLRVRDAAGELEAAEQAVRDAADAAAALTGREPGSSADAVARCRRQVRHATAAASVATKRLAELRPELAKALAERHDLIEAHRERAQVVLSLARAAEAIYLAANLRARRQSGPVTLASHVRLEPDELPEWLVSDDTLTLEVGT